MQLPLPRQLDAKAIARAIDPAKDVDGLHPINAGRLLQGAPALVACTPLGIMEILRRYDVPLEGAEAVVIGRSDIVGKPVAVLLQQANATVTQCHSRTRDLREHCRRADVLVAAVGVPKLVKRDWVKPGAAVIDVGVSVVDGVLDGDVDTDGVSGIARLVTPHRRGVGPMTITMLLRNTLLAYEQRTARMTELRRTPLAALHERLGAPHGAVRGLRDAGAVHLDRRRAPRGARDRGAVRRVAHGPDRARGRRRGRLRRPPLHARDEHARAGPRALCAAVQRGGRRDRRPDRLPHGRRRVPALRERREHRGRPRVDRERTRPRASRVRDESDETGLLALQGPASAAVLGEPRRRGARRAAALPFARTELAGRRVLASRTGYTGADGFELYCDARDAAPLFEALLEAGRAHGLVPAGLGARDTLRLEAALPLYGQELDADTTPLEAGLARFVELEPERDFLGAAAIRRRRDAGFTRALVGFEVIGRGIARGGYPVLAAGARVGRVTSGGPSPTLARAIGLAYVPAALSAPGTAIEIEVRGRAIPARVVETPFVSGKAAGRPTP